MIPQSYYKEETPWGSASDDKEDAFASDFHIGHERINELSGRPYKNVDEMNESILRRVNAGVTANTRLWLVGDLCMGKIDLTLPMLERIACEIVIVAGNHDRIHPYYGRKHEEWIEKYLELSNVSAVHLGETQIEIGGVTATICHFPFARTDERPKTLPDGTVIKDKFAKWRPEDNGQWLICGHVHNNWAQRDRQINIGLDANNGHVVSGKRIAELIAIGPQDREAEIWQPDPAKTRKPNSPAI